MRRNNWKNFLRNSCFYFSAPPSTEALEYLNVELKGAVLLAASTPRFVRRLWDKHASRRISACRYGCKANPFNENTLVHEPLIVKKSITKLESMPFAVFCRILRVVRYLEKRSATVRGS